MYSGLSHLLVSSRFLLIFKYIFIPTIWLFLRFHRLALLLLTCCFIPFIDQWFGCWFLLGCLHLATKKYSVHVTCTPGCYISGFKLNAASPEFHVIHIQPGISTDNDDRKLDSAFTRLWIRPSAYKHCECV